MGEIGSNLLVAHEKPETFFKKLIVPGMMHTVVYQAEICAEERHVEDEVAREMRGTGADCQFEPIWGSTLHHIDDLPYDPKDNFSINYGGFRLKH